MELELSVFMALGSSSIPNCSWTLILGARWEFRLLTELSLCCVGGLSDDEMSPLHCCPLDVEYPGGMTGTLSETGQLI
jgi:hypothetical protein